MVNLLLGRIGGLKAGQARIVGSWKIVNRVSRSIVFEEAGYTEEKNIE
jgi:hypothetical protein